MIQLTHSHSTSLLIHTFLSFVSSFNMFQLTHSPKCSVSPIPLELLVCCSVQFRLHSTTLFRRPSIIFAIYLASVYRLPHLQTRGCPDEMLTSKLTLLVIGLEQLMCYYHRTVLRLTRFLIVYALSSVVFAKTL